MILNLVIIGIGIVCAGELGWLMGRQEHLAKVLEIQIKSLGQTNLDALGILTMDIDKLKAKVKELEDEVL